MHFIHYELKMISRKKILIPMQNIKLGGMNIARKSNDMHSGIIKRLLSVVSKLDIP